MGILSGLFLGAYSGLWRAAQPALRRHKRLRYDFTQRLVPDDWYAEGSSPADQSEATNGPPARTEVVDPVRRPVRVWIQAASGGEAWLVHSLVPAIVEALSAHPALSARPLELLCTTCTQQGLEVLEKLSPLAHTPASVVILPRLFPLDRPALMRRAMDMARPDAVVLLETELWPGLLAAAGERHVPVLALNARMTEKSFNAYGKLGFFWREYAPECILAISPEDADRFARLFRQPGRVRVMPNIKFDRVAESPGCPAESGPFQSFRTEAGIGENVLLVVLASVREEEEAFLLPVVSALHGLSIGGNPVAVAVAPRHMHRVDAWKSRLKEAGVPYSPRSAQGVIGGDEDDAAFASAPPVFLWDTFGELQSLYAIADAVYVGASLVPLGGQNFLEPLAKGIIPLVGPHIDNFRWIGEELFDEGLATMLSGADELLTALESELYIRQDALQQHLDGRKSVTDWQAARSNEADGVCRRFKAWLNPRRGGSRQAAEALVKVLARKG